MLETTVEFWYSMLDNSKWPTKVVSQGTGEEHKMVSMATVRSSLSARMPIRRLLLAVHHEQDGLMLELIGI